MNGIESARHRWERAAGIALGLSVAFGPAFIASFGLYIKPISEEFGWSRTSVSSLYSLVSIIGALGTPFLGFWLDRKGARSVIVASSLLLPLVLAALALIPPVFPLFLAVGVMIGLVSIIASPTAYVSLLPQWFSENLGKAVALGMFGSGLGQFLFAQGHGALLAQLDWRTSWIAMAVLAAIVGIPAAIRFGRDNPKVRTQRELGGEEGLEGVNLRHALCSSAFWFAVSSFFLVLLITTAMLAHLSPMLTDAGWGVETAALAVGLIGLVSLIGRVVCGVLLDRFGFATVGLLLFPMQFAGCLILLQSHGLFATLLAAGLIGLTFGAEADMMPWMLRRTFGLRCFGRLFGIGFGVVQLGAVIGPVLMGLVYDGTGNYQIGLAALAIASIGATALIALAGLVEKRVRL